MREGESVQDHIKAMTELFNELVIVGDAIEEEDRVVYLLASLPDLYNTLVTALEAHEEVLKMEVVTEKLLHAERKQKEKSSPDSSGDKANDTSKVEVHSATTARSMDIFRRTASNTSRPKKGVNWEDPKH